MWGKKQCGGGAAGSGADLSPGHGDRECWRREKLINKISDQQEPSVRSHPPPQSKARCNLRRRANAGCPGSHLDEATLFLLRSNAAQHPPLHEHLFQHRRSMSRTVHTVRGTHSHMKYTVTPAIMA